MTPVGAVCLTLIALTSAAAFARPRTRIAPGLVVATWWGAVGMLGVAFARLDLTLDAVVRYSRASLPAWLRVSSLWAGPSGSLLLWCALVVTALIAADRSARAVRLAAGSSLLSVVVLVAAQNPFAVDRSVPVDGVGLSPVLEHPAMIVHPPLLYLAHAAVIVAAVHAWRRPDDRRRLRSSIAVAAAALVAATAIGSWWAHDELGWGGWWAWDPVENTALAPLAALVAAAHALAAAPTRPLAARRWTVGAGALVLLGVGAARSGLASSVHAFAPSAGPGAVVATAGLAVAAAAAFLGRGDGQTDPADAAGAGRPRTAPGNVVAASAAWVVLVVVSGEVAAAVVGAGDPPGSIDGAVLARTMLPSGVAVVGGLAVWGWRRARGPAVLAHVGAALLAVGIAASGADWSQRTVVEIGGSTTVRGLDVEVGRPAVVDVRDDLERASVDVTVDGRTYRPAILRHLDLERSRGRPARHLDWRGETEVVLTYADGDRVAVEIRRHAGLGQVWAGIGLIAVAFGLVALDGQSRRSRRRFAARSESMDEPPVPSDAV